MVTRKRKVKKKSASRKSISDFVTLALWVKAGGRCEFQGCNDYLLGDGLTGIEPLNLSERAHIVGQSKGKKSPRGNHDLPLSKRNEVYNLMLLCPKHHKLIDKRENWSKFSVDTLRQFKDDHEKRILAQTGIKPGAETTVICLRSKIRGEIVDISKETIWEAVSTEAQKYPRYIIGNNDVDIDLINLSENGTYWQAGKDRISEIMKDVYAPGIAKRNINHISIFGFARIPFLVHLGACLTDKIPTDIYQKNRSSESWLWLKKRQRITFKLKKIQTGKNIDKVALLLSISGKIVVDDVSSHVDDDYSIYEIYPENISPGRNIVQSKSALVAFRNIYQEFLRRIEHAHSGLEKFKLFPAIPLSVSIICGRELLKNVSPGIDIYDKGEQGYNFTMEISK